MLRFFELSRLYYWFPVLDVSGIGRGGHRHPQPATKHHHSNQHFSHNQACPGAPVVRVGNHHKIMCTDHDINKDRDSLPDVRSMGEAVCSPLFRLFNMPLSCILPRHVHALAGFHVFFYYTSKLTKFDQIQIYLNQRSFTPILTPAEIL